MPARMTTILSAACMTSFILCVIKITEFPCFVKSRINCISVSDSCGVRTAVGSSMMRIRAFIYSALRISTFCCTPTASFPTGRSTGMSKPYFRASASIFSLHALRFRSPRLLPRMMFSVAVCVGTREKCCWIIAMPHAIASFGEWICCGTPSMRISPSSLAYRP